MSNQVLIFLIQLISGGLALPSFLLIISSWRVARLRNLTENNYQERVNEAVAETIKEQLSERVISQPFAANHVVLPPGKTADDILGTLVPGDEIEVLTNMYHELSLLGIDSTTYLLLLQTVNK